MSRKLMDINYDDIAAETEKAYLFVFDKEEVWLPKSQIEVDERDKVITLPQSLCESHGLEGYIV